MKPLIEIVFMGAIVCGSIYFGWMLGQKEQREIDEATSTATLCGNIEVDTFADRLVITVLRDD